MRRTFIAVLTPLLAFLPGCSTVQGGKLYMPETFGFVPVAPDIYVEPGTDEATQARLREAMSRARRPSARPMAM